MIRFRGPTAVAWSVLVVGSAAGQVAGQAAGRDEASQPDSVPVALLEELVVTADRAETPIGLSVAAVTRLDGRGLDASRFGGVAELLRLVPGFSLVDRDGSGQDPQPIVRGFYGGGEAEYVVVLMDGRPLNAPHSGLVTWELVPPVSVEAVEVLRGSSSSLYGDAALGGVINFITEDADDGGGHVRLMSAGQGLVRGGIRTSAIVGGSTLRGHASGLRTGGFRDHGDRAALDLGLSYDLLSGEAPSLTASIGSTWRRLEHPGPLPASQLAMDRTSSDVFYRFDETADRVHSLTLRGSYLPGSTTTLTARLTSELRRSAAARTIPLSPGFADTKERELATDGVEGVVQVVWDELGWLSRNDRLVTGVEAAWDRIDSEYFPIASGVRADYGTASGERGAVDASGEGHRAAAAAFAHLDLWPAERVRLSLGVRYDRLDDRFEPRSPSTSEAADAVQSALSPEVGVGVTWMNTATSRGSVYATFGRSFKAPTPDQLFDQRSIPIPFPPFSATTSNARLSPQRGRSLEAGAYQSLRSESGSVGGTLSLAVYQIDMEDEIDFDLSTLQYVNIGHSRHRGLEGALHLFGPGPTTARFSYALQSAVSSAEDGEGLALKAIPRHSWSAGVSASPVSGLDLAADVTGAGGAWLDDANTVRLASFIRTDLRAEVEIPGATSFIEVRNALDERYATTGFLDPAGSGTIYYYPAAGRTVGIGVEVAW